MTFRRLSEKVFGFEVFPAKSGKKTNLIEYEKKLSRTGNPAVEGAFVLTDSTGAVDAVAAVATVAKANARGPRCCAMTI